MLLQIFAHRIPCSILRHSCLSLFPEGVTAHVPSQLPAAGMLSVPLFYEEPPLSCGSFFSKNRLFSDLQGLKGGYYSYLHLEFSNCFQKPYNQFVLYLLIRKIDITVFINSIRPDGTAAHIPVKMSDDNFDRFRITGFRFSDHFVRKQSLFVFMISVCVHGGYLPDVCVSLPDRCFFCKSYSFWTDS